MQTKEEKKQYQRERMRKLRESPEYRKKQAEFYKKWYAEKGRKRAENYNKKINEWDKNNPEKLMARHKIQIGIKNGSIVKPLVCEFCGLKTRLNGHHDDYNKPMEVRWLCSSCHKKLHSKIEYKDKG